MPNRRAHRVDLHRRQRLRESRLAVKAAHMVHRIPRQDLMPYRQPEREPQGGPRLLRLAMVLAGQPFQEPATTRDADVP